MNVRHIMRSKLFVTGSRPEIFAKALQSEADAISFDLEDSVHESHKKSARMAVAEFLEAESTGESDKLLIVRVNEIGHQEFEEDIRAVITHRLDILNIPKLESATEIAQAIKLIEQVEKEKGIRRSIKILANIETPKGLRCAAEIACSDCRLIGLQIGFADLFGALGIDRSDQAAVHSVRLAVRMAAGEAGISAYDAAFLNVRDDEALRLDTLGARRLGFSGKSCIHPAQIAVINSTFLPTDEELTAAGLLLEAAKKSAEKGEGVFMFGGQMIDKPVIEAAQKIVQLRANNR
jgi:citrate lyase subunit beta/citryl-CoA lyase